MQKIWEHTLPFEKLVVKSTSLSNLMVNGSFLARFFLFCWSAVDIEFANPKLCINEKKKAIGQYLDLERKVQCRYLPLHWFS